MEQSEKGGVVKHVFLALLIFVSSQFASASGSDTVFKQLRNYYITSDIEEICYQPRISQSLEDYEDYDLSVLVIKVRLTFYVDVAAIVFNGDEVVSQLEDGTFITFFWDSNLDAVVAYDYNGRLYILSP